MCKSISNYENGNFLDIIYDYAHKYIQKCQYIVNKILQ